MLRAEVVFGPPGCGKTTELLRRLDEELARGIHPARFSFVTFTRAGRKVALRRACDRLRVTPEELPWIRTIHSTAYRLLDLNPGCVLEGVRWREFAERWGYRLSDLEPSLSDHDEDVTPPPRRTPDDLLRFVAEWAQNTRISPSKAAALCPVRGVSERAFELFQGRLTAFKREHGLVGFADMLEAVLKRRLRPPVDVAFIDEAQDLSPLQIAVVEQWFQPCARVHVAGDDDQTIYGFQGALPDWLLGLARRCPTTILSQSHRVPVRVHALATRIIARNQTRAQKEYRPNERSGRIIHLDKEHSFEHIDESVPTFVLARNRIHLGVFGRELVARGVPFVVEGKGARSPLSDRRLVTAITTATALSRGQEAVQAVHLAAMLSYVEPPLVTRATRGRVEELRQEAAELPLDRLAGELGLSALLEAMASRGPAAVLGRVPREELRYLEGLLERNGGALPEPQVVLTSIHGAKGREATRVVLVTSMTRTTFQDFSQGGQRGYESENRVAYVGATRTLEDLILVRPRTRRHFDFPRVNPEAEL